MVSFGYFDKGRARGIVWAMGLLADFLRPFLHDRTFGKSSSYKTVTEYAPAIHTNDGGSYSHLVTRSAIDCIARACGKLKPEVLGTAQPRVRRAIKTAPNDHMTWPQFLYRTATILEADNNAFVVPAYDEAGNITGVWPLKAEDAEVVDYAGEPWIRFYLGSGDVAAIELANVCILTRFQYQSDFFGSGNAPLDPVLRLMDAQDSAQESAIRDGATIRYIGRIESAVRPEDLKAKRDKFSEDNLSAENTSGLLLYDQTFSDLKQVDPKSYTIPTEEMERITKLVCIHYGVNEQILTSDFSEDQWGAFYEQVVEPIAVQLGEGLTKLLYTPGEISRGNRICFSANRLEYATNASKRNMIRDMSDRRIMTINECREVLQLPPVPGGDVFVYRGEYVVMDENGEVIFKSGGDAGDDGANTQVQNEDFDLGGDDQIYADNDTRGTSEKDEDS